MALTLPTTRSLCEALGTVLYTTVATDVFTGSRFKGQPIKVRVIQLPTDNTAFVSILQQFASSTHLYFNVPVLHVRAGRLTTLLILGLTA